MKQSFNKKTIYILRTNPVSPDSRVEKESLSLANNGYNVRIIAWDRNSNHKNETSLLHNNPNITISRIGVKASFGGGKKNIVPFLKFKKESLKILKKEACNIFALHACDYDTACFSYKFAKKKNIHFVFDIFDFKYGRPKGLIQSLVKKNQIKIINQADATIICTEQRLKQIEGSSPKTISIIHNSPSLAFSTSIRVCKSLSNKTKFCYVGILQNGRLIKEICEYFARHSEIELHIAGFGYLESFIKEISNIHKNIFFYGKIPYEKTISLENSCDVIFALYNPAIENNRFAAPNKFYEACFLGKPVIMVKNTGMSENVEKEEVGVLIDYSQEGVAFGVENILSKKEDWKKMRLKLNKMYKDLYSWEIMEERLLNLYASIEALK